ncbi:MAG TPA: hypothetical protein PKW44_08120 [Methylophilaceae bacterium]|nr:hypothetical protein [Methylophilaceae bacterium]
MTKPNREQDAINAYLNLMEKTGADSANLEIRKQFLQRLVALIGGRPQDFGVYREAVDEALEGLNKAEWPFYISVSREYYRFWIDDIKAIAALHASGGYRATPLVGSVPSEELQVLWNNLDQQSFEVAEKWSLKAYNAALRQEGAEPAVVETRTKLVKLLLVQLRETPERDGYYYQGAVDSLMPLFSMKETRELYIQVVREFFYFWISDPEAVSRIVLHQPADD